MPPVLCAAWMLRRTGTLSRLIAIPMIQHTRALALPSVNLHACADRVACGVWSRSYLEGFFNRVFYIGHVFLNLGSNFSFNLHVGTPPVLRYLLIMASRTSRVGCLVSLLGSSAVILTPFFMDSDDVLNFQPFPKVSTAFLRHVHGLPCTFFMFTILFHKVSWVLLDTLWYCRYMLSNVLLLWSLWTTFIHILATQFYLLQRGSKTSRGGLPPHHCLCTLGATLVVLLFPPEVSAIFQTADSS